MSLNGKENDIQQRVNLTNIRGKAAGSVILEEQQKSQFYKLVKFHSFYYATSFDMSTLKIEWAADFRGCWNILNTVVAIDIVVIGDFQ